jgi:hypothetical protein
MPLADAIITDIPPHILLYTSLLILIYLCKGNVKLDGILNLRDLSTVSNKVKPNKLIRTGCISKASDKDVLFLFFLLSYHHSMVYSIFIIL